MRRRELFGSIAAAAGALAARPTFGATRPRPARPPREIVADDGTRLHFRDWGAGRPIVFLAPWSLNSTWWDYHLASLSAAGYRCIAFDRRGHGRSDEPSGGYDFDTLADDLRTVMTELDLQNVLLVGNSMGAAEAVRYLSRHRAARVTQAVLIGTITPVTIKLPDNPGGVPAEALERARTGLMRDRAGVIAAAAAAFFGTPKNPVAPAMLDSWTRTILDNCSMKVMLDLHRTMTETDFRPDLGRITVPTLLVHGDADVSARLDLTARRTRPLIKGSTLPIDAGAAHGLVATHAERLHQDIVAFASAARLALWRFQNLPLSVAT
jgi:non-heme chloroperoxidase